MRRNQRLRVKLKRTDKWRVLLTDTSPFEVPIVVSNDVFTKTFIARRQNLRDFSKLINAVALVDDDTSYTIPFKYNIVRTREASEH